MGKNTKIQWCDSTVNPVMGCSGCELWNDQEKTCYAGQLHLRWPNHPGFSTDFETVKLFPGRMAEAARWSDLSRKTRGDKPWLGGLPRTIFVSDMGDALSEGDTIDFENRPFTKKGVPFEYLYEQIIRTVMSEQGSRHIWQWLTKRPNRMAKFSEWLTDSKGCQWPSNLWAGTSVTSKATLGRVSQLSKVGNQNTIRFVSVEPQWEELRLGKFLSGDGKKWWVVAGGESRQGSSPKEFKVEWARQLRDECGQHGVPFFLKQLGSRPTENGISLKLKDGHGGNWCEWPKALQVRQMPQSNINPNLDISKLPSFGEGQPELVRISIPIAHETQQGEWTSTDVLQWAFRAKAHSIVAIRRLLSTNTALTTHELNAVAQSNSGGAIVGGLLAWAKRRQLMPPLVPEVENGKRKYRFVSNRIRSLFADHLPSPIWLGH